MKLSLFLLVLSWICISPSGAQAESASSEKTLPDSFFTEREDPNCKLIQSDSDGRTRVLCMIDGNIWDTWGQCKTYCR